MAIVTAVDPESFVDVEAGRPLHGRGAWNKTGIGFDYRYAKSEDPVLRIGLHAEESLDQWAVAAGAYAIQQRLVALKHLAPVGKSEVGIFGPRTEVAVQAFQRANRDPDGGAQLDDDGTVGRVDARALFTPLVLAAEKSYGIPGRLLLGETYHESALDPGAVGYYIYYGEDPENLDYRGVDRGMSQINSSANKQVVWLNAFDPAFSLDWSAKRLRTYFEQYSNKYPKRSASVLWDAAVCAHNNPSAAAKWAANGQPPTEAAANYVAGVKAAIY